MWLKTDGKNLIGRKGEDVWKQEIAEIISSVRFLKVGGGVVPSGGWQVRWWEEDKNRCRGREQHDWYPEKRGILRQQGLFALRSRSGVGSGATADKWEKKEIHREEGGFPGDSALKNSPAPAGDTRDSQFSPWVRKIPWRRKWKPAPVILPTECHGQRSLVGYSPWGCKESDTTEGLNTHTAHTWRKGVGLQRLVFFKCTVLFARWLGIPIKPAEWKKHTWGYLSVSLSLKNSTCMNPLVVQWLGLQALLPRAWVQSMAWELRSHMLHSTD